MGKVRQKIPLSCLHHSHLFLHLYYITLPLHIHSDCQTPLRRGCPGPLTTLNPAHRWRKGWERRERWKRWGKGRGGRTSPGSINRRRVTYIRWGRTTCPNDTDSQLVYSGRAGGTRWDHKGGAANYLCMPDDPDHLQYLSGVQGQSSVAGVEYFYGSMPSLSSVNYHNVPCALCYVATRSVAVMIPAKTQCPTNWTLEYSGYLMSEYYSYNRTMYECVDRDPKSVAELNSSNPRAFFVLVEPYCNGLSCPPYNAEKELTCAVCTR